MSPLAPDAVMEFLVSHLFHSNTHAPIKVQEGFVSEGEVVRFVLWLLFAISGFLLVIMIPPKVLSRLDHRYHFITSLAPKNLHCFSW
jgi:hypothetical protein